MDEKAVTVALPAIARKGFGRGAPWTVTVNAGSPAVTGTANFLNQARENAGTAVEEILRNVETGPAFALDDDGGVVIAVPYGAGSLHYKVIDGQARMIGSSIHAPKDSLNAHHYTHIPTDV